jgi:hypothetical protein
MSADSERYLGRATLTCWRCGTELTLRSVRMLDKPIRTVCRDQEGCDARWKEHGGVQQVVICPWLMGAFRDWLSSRGLTLFPMPAVRGDLPTFGIGS